MTVSEVEAFLSSMENVQRTENFGYAFFFVGDDHRLPFATIADSDNEHDRVSDLNRDGVFRVNFGVSRETFQTLSGPIPDDIEYSVLNTFLPHPEYSSYNFLCILNPAGANVEKLQTLLREAHAIAAARLERKSKS